MHVAQYFIVSCALHKSTKPHGDKRDHYTADAYVNDPDRPGIEIPIGCVHIYEDGKIMPFREPRTKCYAVRVYECHNFIYSHRCDTGIPRKMQCLRQGARYSKVEPLVMYGCASPETFRHTKGL